MSLRIGVVLLLLATAGCSEVGGDEVTFRVEGSGSGTVTYGSLGATNQADVPFPWSESLQMDDFDFASLVAQSNEEGANLTCTIEVGGEVLESATASGDFAVCTVSA